MLLYLAVCVFHFVLGDPANFMNNDPNNHPLPVTSRVPYKGGVIVPVLQTLFLTVIVAQYRTRVRHHQGQRKRQRHQIVKNVKEALDKNDTAKPANFA